MTRLMGRPKSAKNAVASSDENVEEESDSDDYAAAAKKKPAARRPTYASKAGAVKASNRADAFELDVSMYTLAHVGGMQASVAQHSCLYFGEKRSQRTHGLWVSASALYYNALLTRRPFTDVVT